MEDLKTMLDKYQLKDLEKQLELFVSSAEKYPDVLKLTLALTFILRQSVELLSKQDISAFIGIVRKKLEDLENSAKQCLEQYQRQFNADIDLMHVLGLCDDANISKLSGEISDRLVECEKIIKELVDELQKLPTEQLPNTPATPPDSKR